MRKKVRLKNKTIRHEDFKKRADEYGFSLEKYYSAKEKGRLPIRKITKSNRKKSEQQKAGEVVSISLDEYKINNDNAEIENAKVENKVTNNSDETYEVPKIAYDIIDSQLLNKTIQDGSLKDLLEIWEHRIERISSITDACKLLSELRFRQGIDIEKRDPRTFYKTDQIQDLLEHLDDDFVKTEISIETKSLTGKRKGEVTQTIREGQTLFRKKLIEYYGCKCMVTGEKLAEVIEAAHIHSYNGQHTNEIGNGMLLRSDIHKLYDRGLIAIEPGKLVIRISDELKESGYSKLEGQDLIVDRLPAFKQGIFDDRWKVFKI